MDSKFKPEDKIKFYNIKDQNKKFQNCKILTNKIIHDILYTNFSYMFIYANYLRKYAIINAKSKIGKNKKIQNFILYSILEKDEKFNQSKILLKNLEKIFENFSKNDSNLLLRLKSVLKDTYNNPYVIMELDEEDSIQSEDTSHGSFRFTNMDL